MNGRRTSLNGVVCASLVPLFEIVVSRFCVLPARSQEDIEAMKRVRDEDTDETADPFPCCSFHVKLLLFQRIFSYDN